MKCKTAAISYLGWMLAIHWHGLLKVRRLHLQNRAGDKKIDLLPRWMYAKS